MHVVCVCVCVEILLLYIYYAITVLHFFLKNIHSSGLMVGSSTEEV